MDISPASSARRVGLRYVSDNAPGIRRLRRGRHFAYVHPTGRPVRDRATLTRIRSLAIPPAYEEVWICPLPEGHVQATGRDARRRKQYRYHPRWREHRDETKYERLSEFARALPAVRRRVATDLRRKHLDKEKILAAVILLLERTAVRVGNDEYARANRSFGLTTLRKRHARVRGNRLQFRFRGKSGVLHSLSVIDHRLARIVRECQELPDQRLFEYVDAEGRIHPICSHDVNDYVRNVSGADFTAKDFRTWLGTVRCAAILSALPPVESINERKRNLAQAMRLVAAHLGNTPAVARKCYVHPAIVDAYLDGRLGNPPERARRARGLSAEERFAAAILRHGRRINRSTSQALGASLRSRSQRSAQ
ncbi:MAG: DNA topoisomerase IB [Candidatus Eremiobacteraeota bacterium]|nr:DNA topoisomerase IB [Candidatus Eremiobacteraeota bacterium]